MKNIHILSTDKPSKLFIIDKSKMFKPEAPYLSFASVGGRVHKIEGEELYQPQNMYITSDEEIKNCWVINIHLNEVYFTKGWYGKQPLIKKIILTTDEDLIKYGVQAVDDEFLQWFVKNSDCEFVEVEKSYRKERNNTGMIGSPMSFTVFDKYKINTPTEELIEEQEWISPMQKFKKKNIIDTWLEKNGDPEINKQVEKEAVQLELEDAGIQHCNLIDTYPQLENPLFSFKQGAKWQAKRLYSEEQVLEQLNLLHNMRSSKIDTYTDEDDCITMKWFKQFKK